MNICVIPARGGSKRIPRKNIKSFCGRPMISYSITAALESNCFDYIVCSTDDKEIAAIARKYGAKTPFFRPDNLSDDYTGTAAVVAHAIEYFQSQGSQIDLVCCIYATAPFIQTEDIRKSLEQIQSNDIDYCFSATSYPFPIQRSIKIIQNNRCEMFQPEMFSKRSQDLEEAYHDAGQFYWGKADAWLQDRAIFSKSSIPYILPRYRVQDIDTEEDWIRAETMHEVLKKTIMLK